LKKVNNGNENLIGIILAGGESSRFGTPKAFATYEDKHFYQHAIDALTPYVNQIVIVSHPSIRPRFDNLVECKVIEDIEPYIGKGPLSGLYSAMHQFHGSWYIVLPCDMPCFNSIAAKKLLSMKDDRFDAIVPQIAGSLHPLSAVYHRRSFRQLELQLATGNYRLINFIERLSASILTEQQLELDEGAFQNINDWNAYKRLGNGKHLRE
jgi:molybdopterin-guanine dinucleotide biosynthesis protein A